MGVRISSEHPGSSTPTTAVWIRDRGDTISLVSTMFAREQVDQEPPGEAKDGDGPHDEPAVRLSPPQPGHQDHDGRPTSSR